MESMGGVHAPSVWRHLGVFVLAIGGCFASHGGSSDGDADEDRVGPVALIDPEDPVGPLIRATCEHEGRCFPESDVGQSVCEGMLVDPCGIYRHVTAADGAEECIAGLEADDCDAFAAPCHDALARARARTSGLPAPGGEGAPCGDGVECLYGFLCGTDAETPIEQRRCGSCYRAGRLGEPCGIGCLDGWCAGDGVCREPLPLGAECSEHPELCESGECGPDHTCMSTDLPADPAPVGASCTDDLACVTSRCTDGRCTARESLGSSCSTDRGCESGACVEGVCARLGLPRAPCQHDWECLYGQCRQGLCAYADACGGGGAQAACGWHRPCAQGMTCDSTTGRCRAPAADGNRPLDADCERADQCASSNCDYATIAGRDVCRLSEVGSSCFHDADCKRGPCRWGSCVGEGICHTDAPYPSP